MSRQTVFWIILGAAILIRLLVWQWGAPERARQQAIQQTIQQKGAQ